MPKIAVVLLNDDEGRALVRKKCRGAGVKMATFERLVAAELDQQGKMRRTHWEDFDQILDEEFEQEGR